MSDKLTGATNDVKRRLFPSSTYPTDETLRERAVELVATVRPFVPLFLDDVSESEIEDGMLACHLVELLINRDNCLCNMCIGAFASGRERLFWLMRAEVLHRTGVHVLKRAHRSIVRQE